MRDSEWNRLRAPEERVRILSEAEIQQKLYGTYTGVRKGKPPSASPTASREPWTGSEILLEELNRLRSELALLRQQKEQLEVQLRQMDRPRPDDLTEAAHFKPFPRAGVWVALALMVGTLGYFGVKKLQASPISPAADPTPYTLQVAVYDMRLPAEEAVEFLRRLQYDAFLVETTRQDGKVRYRLYVGRFVTKAEAELERLRLLGDPRFRDFKDAFVRFR